jgi:hypothetical protein
VPACADAPKGNVALAGNLLTVDWGWGSSTLVIYALGGRGRLTGVWDGRGEETLTPER